MVKLPSKFKNFLEEQKFKLINGRFFGSKDVYANGKIFLRVIKDYNGFKSLEIAVNQTGDWFDLNIIRSYILKRNAYMDEKDFEVRCTFLIDNYNNILELLNSINYSDTLSELTKIERSRAEILFGKDQE